MFWYNFFSIIAGLTGLIFLIREFKREKLPVLHAIILTAAILISSRIGAYLLYSFETDVWRDNWYDYLIFNRGGMALHGGLYTAVFVIFIYSKILKTKFLYLLDLISIPVLFAFSVGRLGCLSAGCCRGFVLPDQWVLPDFFKHEHLFPAPLLHSIVNIIIGLILMRLPINTNNPGIRTAWFIVLYSLARFLIELLRNNPKVSLGMTMVQILTIFGLIAGLILLRYVKFNTQANCSFHQLIK